MELTQSAVLSFLLERGGSVRNSELVCAFTRFINCSEPAERKRNRDAFKSYINSVATVQQINEVKHVVVRKKYQKMIRSEGNLEQVSLESSAAPSSSCITKQGEVGTTNADDLNNNLCTFTSKVRSTSYNCSQCEDLPTKQRTGMSTSPITMVRTTQQDLLTARVLVADSAKTGTMGTVFAVVAQKSPQCLQSEGMQVVKDSAVQQRSSFKTVPQHAVSGNLKCNSGSKRRLCLVPNSPAPKRGNKPLGLDARYSLLFPLTPLEHEWIVKSATGHWSQLKSLLLQDVHLAEKRNFISGFTALHWAAKHGNIKMVHRILGVSRLDGIQVDVNIKSHDGYTPLHIAAIHSHESVLKVLVSDYGASCNIRDNSGKKAYYYLRKDVSPEVRQMLGEPDVWHQVTKQQVACPNDLQHFLEIRKGVNMFSKLLKESVGHGKKFRHGPSFRFKND